MASTSKNTTVIVITNHTTKHSYTLPILSSPPTHHTITHQPILSSCHRYSCRWCPYFFRRLAIVTLAVDARTDFVVLPSLLLPLMPVLLSSSCHRYSCRWCPYFFRRLAIVILAVDARTDLIVLPSLLLPLMPVLLKVVFERFRNNKVKRYIFGLRRMLFVAVENM